MVENDDSMDSDMIKNWQAVCQDETSNEYRKTEINDAIPTVMHFKNIREGGFWVQCTADMIGAFGKGRKTTVYRWVSLAKNLTFPGNSRSSVWSGAQNLGTSWA